MKTNKTKKVGIITLLGNKNYGNKLQNYALIKTLQGMNCSPYTIRYSVQKREKMKLSTIVKSVFLRITNFIVAFKYKKIEAARKSHFIEFDKTIPYNDSIVKDKTAAKKLKKEFDYFVVGSDQIWNPKYYRLTWLDLIEFADNNQKISYAASFGIDYLPEDKIPYVKTQLNSFKKISVRENAGKNIIEQATGRKDVQVLIDPTMLIKSNEWIKEMKRPVQLDSLKKSKYILNYTLGKLPNQLQKEINRVAQENDCQIINILDKNDPFYKTGPREFLYLEKNAFLVCTDSFHSSVFAILFKTPFIVFNRVHNKNIDMNSRIDTLLAEFNLRNRLFNGKINKKILDCNYEEAIKILNKKREIALKFLKESLEI